eukprot:scaffold2.g6911.t1
MSHNAISMPSPCLDALAAVLEAFDGLGDGARGQERMQAALDALCSSLAATSDADAAEALRALGLKSSELRTLLKVGNQAWRTIEGVMRLADKAWEVLALHGPEVLGASLGRVGLQLGSLAAAVLATRTEQLDLHTRHLRAAAPAGCGACSIHIEYFFDMVRASACFADRLATGLQALSEERFVPALRATSCKPALITDVLRGIRGALLLTSELAESWEEWNLLVASKAGYGAASCCVTLFLVLHSRWSAKAPLLRPEAEAALADAALTRQPQHAALLCIWKLLQSPAPADESWVVQLQPHVMLLASDAARHGGDAAADTGRRDWEAAALIRQHQAVTAAAAAWAQELRGSAARLPCDLVGQLAALCGASAHALADWQKDVPPGDLATWTAHLLTTAAYAAQEAAAALDGIQLPERGQQPSTDWQSEHRFLVRLAVYLAQGLEEATFQLTSAGALMRCSTVPLRLAAAMLAGAEAFLRLRARAQRLHSALRSSDSASPSEWASALLEDMQQLPTQALACGAELVRAVSSWELGPFYAEPELTAFFGLLHATALAIGRSAHAAAVEAPAPDDF